MRIGDPAVNPTLGDGPPARSELVTCSTAKGGQGCTIVALVTAILLGRTRPHPVDLTGRDPDELAAAAGRTLGFEDEAIALTPTVHLLTDRRTSRAPLVVHDAGRLVDGPDPGIDGPHSYLVTRACFLALRAARNHSNRPRGIVLVEEPGRAITRDDIADALDAPVVATIPHTPDIARLVDAGLVATRTPAVLEHRLARLLIDLDQRRPGRDRGLHRPVSAPDVDRHRQR